MMSGAVASAVEMKAMVGAWRELVSRWALTWSEMRALLPAGGEDATAPPKDTEARMRILVEVDHRLRVGEGEELHEWLREPSEPLLWNSPLETMSSSLRDLRRFRCFVETGFGS